MNRVYKEHMVYELTTDSDRRKRKREARVQQILDSAMGLIVENGVSGLTIHRLADALDLTPGAFYRYFKSKDAILATLVGTVVVDLTKVLAVSRDAVPADGAVGPEALALARLLAIVGAYRTFAKTRPSEFHLIRISFGHPEELLEEEFARPLLDSVFTLFGIVSEAFVGAHDVKALDPGTPMDRTIALWTSLQGVLQLEKLGRFHADVNAADRLADDVVHTLLKGWGADVEALDEAQTYVAQLG